MLPRQLTEIKLIQIEATKIKLKKKKKLIQNNDTKILYK